jgi:hypothetical protein
MYFGNQSLVKTVELFSAKNAVLEAVFWVKFRRFSVFSGNNMGRKIAKSLKRYQYLARSLMTLSDYEFVVHMLQMDVG